MCFSCFAGERTALILEEAAGQGQRQEETCHSLVLHTGAACCDTPQTTKVNTNIAKAWKGCLTKTKWETQSH